MSSEVKMAIQEENYDFKYTSETHFNWKEDKRRDFEQGKYFDDNLVSLMQYILLNLSNITLKFISISQVKAMAKNHRDNSFKGSLTKAVELGFCDTILEPFGLSGTDKISYHFSPPFEFQEVVIATIASPASSDKQFSLKGIEPSVWATLLVCLLILSLICAILKVNFIRLNLANRFLFLEYAWYFVSDLLQNPQDIFPARISAKFLAGGWLLGTMVLIKAYTGNLKSDLMTSKTIRINTLEDLSKSPGTRPAIRGDGPFMGYALKTRNKWPLMDKLLREAYQYDDYKMHPQLHRSFPNGTAKFADLISREEMKNRLHRGLFKDWLQKYLKSSGRGFYFGNKNYFTQFGVFMFNKNLPKRILEQVDYLTIKFFETDQIRRYRMRTEFDVQPMIASAATTEINELSAVTFDELFISFFIWKCGMSFASVCFFFEFLPFFIRRLLQKSLQRGRLTTNEEVVDNIVGFFTKIRNICTEE